jgi:serine protease
MIIRPLALVAGIALTSALLPGCQPQPAAPAAASKAAPPRPAGVPVVQMAPEDVQKLLEKRTTLAFVPGQVVVKLKTGVRAAPMASREMARLQIEPAAQLTSGGEQIYRVATVAARSMGATAVADRTLELVKTLAARPDVAYAQPNYIVQISAVPNDPGYLQQWHYFDNGSGVNRSPGGINLPQVWDKNKGSAAVVVAVIDTGILPDHPDINGSPNLVAGYDMIGDPFIANDGGGRDNDPTDPGDASAANECSPGSPAQPSSWHGTHVAGTVGVGNTNNGVGLAGVNWNVKVQPVRVIGKCGGTMVDINDGIRWAAGLPVPGVPINPTPARVINLSLGGGSPCSASPATQAAINDAIARGVTIVVAAGNDAADAANFVPASCNGVITVAASDFRGRLVTRYSNFGPRIDIMAPGGDTARDDNGDGQNDGVLSMVQGGYARYNGTSMASPHVAGVAALMLANQPTLTPAQVRDALKNSALPRSAIECPLPCGAGLLNARAALGPGTSPPPAPTDVVLNPTTLNVAIGQNAALQATVSAGGPPVSGMEVQFTSSNPAVVSVTSASGSSDVDGNLTAIITAVAQGSATITANADGHQATSSITVPGRSSALPLTLVSVLASLALIGGWLQRRRIAARHR